MKAYSWNEPASIVNGFNNFSHAKLRDAVPGAVNEFNSMSRDTAIKLESGELFSGLDLLALDRNLPRSLYEVRRDARMFLEKERDDYRSQRCLTKLICGAVSTLREQGTVSPWTLQFLDLAATAVRGGYSLAASAIDMALMSESEVPPLAWASAKADGVTLDTIAAKADEIGRAVDAYLYP